MAPKAFFRLAVDQAPELFGTALGQRVLDRQAAAQAHYVGGAVAALDAFPARIGGPVLLESGDLLFAAELCVGVRHEKLQKWE